MNRDAVINRADRLGNQVVSGKGPGTLVRSSADLHAGTNRKYREHDRYSEKNEQQFLLHGATSCSVIGVIWGFAPKLGATLAPSGRNAKSWH